MKYNKNAEYKIEKLLLKYKDEDDEYWFFDYSKSIMSGKSYDVVIEKCSDKIPRKVNVKKVTNITKVTKSLKSMKIK